MKGKISLYFSMPNFQRFRQRVSEPSKTFTSEFRQVITDTVVSVLNKSSYDLKAEFIRRVEAQGNQFKSEAHKQKVLSLFENFFDTFFTATADEMKNIADETSEETESSGEPDSPAPAETQQAEDFE